MRTISNRPAGFLSEAVRLRLQYADSTTKLRNNTFLRQHVAANSDRVQVAREDGSVILAVLHDARTENNLIESAVNRRMRGSDEMYGKNGMRQHLSPGTILDRMG